MFLELIRYCKSYVRVHIKGYSPERFLNLCHVHKIPIWDVKREGGFYEFNTSIAGFYRMRPLVHKTGVKIRILEKHGLRFWIFGHRKRKMFFGGFFVCAVLLWIMSQFIWNIHIEGNISHSTEEVLFYLEELEVFHGCRKQTVSCGNIEKKIRNQFPEFLWVSVQMKGTRIFVQIKENEDPDIVSEIQETEYEPSSIVALESGKVTSMIVRTGTPLVSVGDQVEKGQILVAGYYAIENDAKEVIRYEPVEADGDIWIQSDLVYKEKISAEYEKKIKTGKRKKTYGIYVLGKEFSWNQKIKYEHYEMKETKKTIKLTENFYLPVSWKKILYEEYETEKAVYSKDAVEKIFWQHLLKKYENILEKGVQITGKNVTIKANGNFYECEAVIWILCPSDQKIPAQIPKVNDSLTEGDLGT